MKRGNSEIHNNLRTRFVNVNPNKKNHNKELKVLIVEDHPIMQKEIAKTFFTLNRNQTEYFFSLDMAFNCEEAYTRLEKSKNSKHKYDLITLDIRLHPYINKKIYSGEEISHWIKNNLSPSPKIIIITFINDRLRIENILKNVNPDGLIVKDDITCNTLLEAVKNTFKETPFYTESVTHIARKLISNDFILDQLDKRLLYELSCGATMKELIELLSISKSVIQKRKNRLMDIFDIKNKSVRNLVLIAKEKDFI